MIVFYDCILWLYLALCIIYTEGAVDENVAEEVPVDEIGKGFPCCATCEVIIFFKFQIPHLQRGPHDSQRYPWNLYQINNMEDNVVFLACIMCF